MKLMYSGTTLRLKSGRIMGAHQRLDRLARRNMRRILPHTAKFPDIRAILYFEGKNGPDGIKTKSPGHDEPWHFIDPTNPDDRGLYDLARDHVSNLAVALKSDNISRAAFEAAWLAHTITDGLTPAHHYPLADKIEELWGKPHTERQSRLDKNVIRGQSRRDSVSKNWQYWGAKGVFTTHLLFELGFASAISGYRFGALRPSDTDLHRVEKGEFEALFAEAVSSVYQHGLYEIYYKRGWTAKLARESREFLAPLIVRIIMLSWYAAYMEANC